MTVGTPNAIGLCRRKRFDSRPLVVRTLNAIRPSQRSERRMRFDFLAISSGPNVERDRSLSWPVTNTNIITSRLTAKSHRALRSDSGPLEVKGRIAFGDKVQSCQCRRSDYQKSSILLNHRYVDSILDSGYSICTYIVYFHSPEHEAHM